MWKYTVKVCIFNICIVTIYLGFIERCVYILYLCVSKYFNMWKVLIPHCPFLNDKVFSVTFPIFFRIRISVDSQPYMKCSYISEKNSKCFHGHIFGNFPALKGLRGDNSFTELCKFLWDLFILCLNWRLLWVIVARSWSLWLIVACCDSLCFVVACCGWLKLVVTHCGSLWLVVVRCSSLWFVVARCGSLWLFVVYCGSLWLVVARCGLLWFVVARCGSFHSLV